MKHSTVACAAAIGVSLMFGQSLLATGAAKKQARAGPAKSTAASPVLFDIKGIKLETPIDDFRKIPSPGGWENTKVVCTDDLQKTEPYELRVDADEAALGIKKCIWWRENLTASYDEHVKGFGLGTGPFGTISYEFKFIKDPRDGVEKLYSFFATTNSDAHGDIVSLLAAKYGPPKITNGAVQNGFGATFVNRESMWANSLSILTVKERWLSANKMAMMMTVNRLLDIVDAAAKAKRTGKVAI